jgi:hypothetical protein
MRVPFGLAAIRLARLVECGAEAAECEAGDDDEPYEVPRALRTRRRNPAMVMSLAAKG